MIGPKYSSLPKRVLARVFSFFYLTLVLVRPIGSPSCVTYVQLRVQLSLSCVHVER